MCRDVIEPPNLALAANAKPGALLMQWTAASGGSKWSRGDQGGVEHRLRSDLLAVFMPICESGPIRAQLRNSVVHKFLLQGRSGLKLKFTKKAEDRIHMQFAEYAPKRLVDAPAPLGEHGFRPWVFGLGAGPRWAY